VCSFIAGEVWRFEGKGVKEDGLEVVSSVLGLKMEMEVAVEVVVEVEMEMETCSRTFCSNHGVNWVRKQAESQQQEFKARLGRIGAVREFATRTKEVEA
jgi:hypothetical protein